MIRLLQSAFAWIENPLHPAGIVLAGLGAVLSVFLVLGFYQIGAPGTRIPLYQSFPEWERTTSSGEPIVCEPRTAPAFSAESVTPQSPTRIEILRAMLATELGQIAQWGRLLTIFLSVLFALLVYRVQLVTQYETAGDAKSGAIFREHRKTRRDFIGGRVVIAFSVGIVAYVLGSLLWIYIGRMFAGVVLPLVAVIPLLFIYSFIMLLIVVRLVARMRTQDMLIFGLMTFAIGLMGSFGTVADACWWQESISYVGTDTQADFLFAVTLLGVSALFAILLLDLQKMARLLVEAGVLGNRDPLWITLTGVGIVLGIAGVALAPINGAPWVQLVHRISAFGTSILIILAMFLAPLKLGKLFGRVLRWLSWLLGALSILYVVLYFGLGWINFVALELLIFSGFGAWLYAIVTTILQRVSQLDDDSLTEYLHRVYPPRVNRAQGVAGSASPGE